MRISTKLIAITLGSGVIVSGLITALVLDVKSVATGYTHIMQGPVAHAEQARQAQVDFNVQVQDWKNILLRGQNTQDLAKDTLRFHEQEAKVKTEVGALAVSVDDPASRTLLTDFLLTNDTLSAEYQAAYGVYVKQGFNSKGADALVRADELAPNDLFNYVVTQLNAEAAASASAERAKAVRQLLILLSIVGVLLFVDTMIYCSVLFGVIKRLGQLKAVSDRLAVADIEGLSIDISGHDEIGGIGESLKGVEAALHELLAVHAH
jgi:methyl-accepting chemotaxis protein